MARQPRFIEDDGVAMTQSQIEGVQNNVSNCGRPEKGIEYRQQEEERMDW